MENRATTNAKMTKASNNKRNENRFGEGSNPDARGPRFGNTYCCCCSYNCGGAANKKEV